MTGTVPEPDGLAEALRILGHPSRLAILRVVAGGERAVGEIAAATGMAMSTLSQQLAILRNAGLVRTRREARQVFYALDAGALDGVVTALVAIGRLSLPPVGSPAPATGANTGAAMFARVKPRA